MSICGGLTEVKDATPKIQTMCDECLTLTLCHSLSHTHTALPYNLSLLHLQVKAAVDEKVGKNYYSYTAKKYKSQIVAGTNYFIKVHVGGDDYIHIRVFDPLPVYGNKKELGGVQTNKTESDEIVYF
ncbi:cystatin-B-like [Clupea harengus]|uniref:Cystatin-B n=1 Tax=Clupea harengus TaxID=7950 RepID=A0A8M1KEU4_CLUHA|nr:cystatin-B-like [Clupea harengus]